TSAVAVVGEAGIGKTRLSSEFLGWAASQGADILRGRAFETGEGLPYGPVVDALRERLDRERAPDDLLDDVWLSELSRLLPELRERYPDLSAPDSDEVSARARLFEAVSRLGGALAQRSPLVLFVDDLHWADRASLDVLRYAGRRWAEGGVPAMILAGLRSEALESDLALAGWLADLGRDLPVKRLPLDALTGEDTAELLRAMSSERAGLDRLGRWLHGETGGQPFFVVEMIQALFEEGVLAAGEVVAPEELGSILPSRVREVVRVRIERLGPAAGELLTAGAVLGEGFTFEHLHRVAQIGEGEALRAMDEALGSHLLREARRGSGYAFAHDKIGEVVYTEAGDARRRVFHRRALTILEEEAAPPASLARHAFAAGLSGAAFRHSIAAGDAAMELFAARDAISHYERSRRLVSDAAGTTLPVEGIEHLHVNLGRAHELVGEWDEAAAVYEGMLAHAREEREPSLEWAALNRMAILRGQRFFDMDAATSLAREALSVAEASGDRTSIAETEWNLTQMAALGWRMDEAFAHGERALSLARELGLVELEARTLYILGISCFMAGRFEEAVEHTERAAGLYASVDSREMKPGALHAQFVWAGTPPSGPMANRAMEVFCLAVLALAEINRGEPRRATEAGRKAYETGRRINNDWTRVFGGACLAHGLAELGKYGEALRVCEDILDTARSLPNPIARLFTLFPLIDARQGVLNLEDARRACLEALALGDRQSMRPYRHIIVSRLCANHALAGGWEEAHAYARESAKARDETPVPLTRMDFVRHHETEALLRGGDEERAREDVRVLGEHVGGNRRFRLVHLRASAVISRWDGEAEEAIEQLREAALLAEEMGLSGELWQVNSELGELLRASGREEEAGRAFAASAEVISSIADKLEDEELQAGFLAQAAHFSTSASQHFSESKKPGS
ncbi:MAG: ATP-binding protein, partial [Rubrobacteraceae bacterium]